MEYQINEEINLFLTMINFNKEDLNNLITEDKQNDNLIVLNTDFIADICHILIAVKRAVHNFYVLKKHKSEKLKKEIIYHVGDKNKIEPALKMHRIDGEGGYYLLFINQNEETRKQIIERFYSDLNNKSQTVSVENFSKYVNLDRLKKEFEVKDEELESEGGLIGAIYNKIALKDLK
jgi:tRNA threonylcarbamoyladenosine modification (KEOPS) complex Cgi121 subunit